MTRTRTRTRMRGHTQMQLKDAGRIGGADGRIAPGAGIAVSGFVAYRLVRLGEPRLLAALHGERARRHLAPAHHRPAHGHARA